MTITNLKPFRSCFSFAAYTKNLIEYLKSAQNIPISDGLTDSESSSIESTFNFKFPPDLKCILQEGLPNGPGFPNWRSSCNQQIEILINLPLSGLCKEVFYHNFWFDSWGNRPVSDDEAVILAKGFLKKAPLLIPIYRNFYIPSTPCLAGNPIFYVNGDDVRLWTFDLTGFFQRVDFRKNDEFLKRPTLSKLLDTPAWAATKGRRIEFWTAMVERKEKQGAEDGMIQWWCEESGGNLSEVVTILRNGGWKEDDVREMMMMDIAAGDCDGEDERSHDDDGDQKKRDKRKKKSLDMVGVTWHVRLLSKRLLRAGWSTEDVMEALDFTDEDDQTTDSPTDDSFFDDD